MLTVRLLWSIIFGKDCNNYHVHTFREAMEAIEEGAADYAVLPIENSTAGAVNEIYDLLVEFEIILSERRSFRLKYAVRITGDRHFRD